MALFGEKKDAGPMKEEKPVSAKAGQLNALLGKGSEFEGKLSFEGEVRIDGKFSGQIVTKDTLTIGEGARVTADISAGVIIISGTVEGTIRANQMVELHAPARVKGAIETPAMAMEKGVIFEGTTKMENLSGNKQPAVPPPPAPLR
jgi:cytoskeletal protein CcmA (bactofilin family)